MLALLTAIWLLETPAVFQWNGIFPPRGAKVQLSGIVAVGAMSVAMARALRPRLPGRWFGGLNKMYRLHKWLGIAALVAAVVHRLWSQGPKWAVGWGWLQPPVRGQMPAFENPVQAVSWRSAAPPKGWANGPYTPAYC